jgi:hypothetical protein
MIGSPLKEFSAIEIPTALSFDAKTAKNAKIAKVELSVVPCDFANH